MVIALLLVTALDLQLVQHTDRADWYRMGSLSVKPQACEAFLRKAEEELGVHVPRFTYIRVRTAAEVSDLNRDHLYVGGITEPDSRRIISTEACSRHEIAHLVMLELGRTDRIFEEGIATMLGGDYPVLDRWLMHQEARDLARSCRHRYRTIERSFSLDLASDQHVHQWYVLGDGWVRHLVKRHGIARLAEFFRASSVIGDSRHAFRIVYGSDLDSTFHRWLYGKHSGPP
jgi:hypothetical protein